MSLGRRLGMLLENATERRILANLVGDVICVNHHKLKNDLRDYTEVLGYKRPLAAVFSTLVTLLAVVVTSESNDVLLTSYAWRLVFKGSLVGALVWLCYCCYLWLRFRWSKISTVDGILGKIKEGSVVLRTGGPDE